MRVHCSSWHLGRRVMSQSFHCLSEVGDVASLREWLMILAASQMPRNTMVPKLSPRTLSLPMRPYSKNIKIFPYPDLK